MSIGLLFSSVLRNAVFKMDNRSTPWPVVSSLSVVSRLYDDCGAKLSH